MNLGLDQWDLCFVIYMFLSNNPSSGDINSSNLSCLCLVFVTLSRLFFAADFLDLVCDVYCYFVAFPFRILRQVWYLIVSIPDPCCLSYFESEGAEMVALLCLSSWCLMNVCSSYPRCHGFVCSL